uniref:Transposase Tnp1/En/Spm-like domain-containing protein n=3 Tax=Fagus sylvatica TaxID=28930 RepID=A0A2N9JAY4_FAGSY
MNALKLKKLAASMDSSQSKGAHGKKKRISIEVPSTDDGDSDDESSNSFMHEVIEMPPGRIRRSPLQHTTLEAQLAAIPPMSRPEEDSPIPPNPQVDAQIGGTSGGTVASTNTRTRGPTRGIGVQRLFDKDGKLPVPIPQEFRKPVGKNASKCVNQIGVQVRQNMPNIGVRKWKKVADSIKQPMYQCVEDKFDLQGDSVDVNKSLNTKFANSLRQHVYRLHTKYKKAKLTHGDEYVRNHPPENVTAENWIELIDKKWTDSDFKELSLKNKKNRNENPDKNKHRVGSKSLAVRVHEGMEENDGQLPKATVIYRETHYDPKKKKWITSEAERNYEEMLRLEEEHLVDPDAIPLTPEEVSVRVLKPRSGYVKGLGIRPSSSLRTIASSGMSKDDVQRQIAEIKEAANSEIAELKEANKRHEEMTANILEFLRSQGFTTPFGNGGSSSSSYRGDGN